MFYVRVDFDHMHITEFILYIITTVLCEKKVVEKGED